MFYCFAEFQEESLKKQGELLTGIKDLAALLKQVLASNPGAASATKTIWPLKTREALLEAEELLKNPDHFANEVSANVDINGEIFFIAF